MTSTERKRAEEFVHRFRLSKAERAQVERIDSHGGHGYGAVLVHAHEFHKRVPLHLLCAVIEHESGFRNIYGHDPVRNPIKSPPGGGRVVTRKNYLAYKAFRKAGLGMQGVGLPQLTWWEFQDRADRYGGCWVSVNQVRVAVERLGELIRERGQHAGVAGYNGDGPAAKEYARVVLGLADVWAGRLR